MCRPSPSSGPGPALRRKCGLWTKPGPGDGMTELWRCLASKGHVLGLAVPPAPYRLQQCGASEGHPTPTSTRSGAPCQQATPWLLWPPTQPPPSLRPQHYHHHKSVSVGGPPGLVPLGAEGVSSPWSAPRLKPPPPSSTARARLTPAPRAYLAPRDFRERNLQLIQSVRGLLASDEARFSEFRSRSGEFRQVRRAGGWGPAQPPGPRPGRA